MAPSKFLRLYATLQAARQRKLFCQARHGLHTKLFCYLIYLLIKWRQHIFECGKIQVARHPPFAHWHQEPVCQIHSLLDIVTKNCTAVSLEVSKYQIRFFITSFL